jgi:hypothetical protein
MSPPKISSPAKRTSTGTGKSSTFTPAPLRNSDMSLHDSGFISPPTTLVKYEVETPCRYNLRPVRCSSTPLPAPHASHSTPLLQASTPAPGPASKSYSSPALITSTPAVPKFVEVLEFNKRLLDSCGDSVDTDSGFESLLSSNFSACPDTSDCSQLGAVPKRRSPRIQNKQSNSSRAGCSVDGIERLTRIRSDKTVSKEDSAEFVLFHPARSLHSVSSRTISREGREHCDLLRHLYHRNLSHILGSIFTYLKPNDLCNISQVSQLWNLAVKSSKVHEERRLNFVAAMKIEQENFGLSLLLSKRSSPRQAMQEVANTNRLSPPSKRDLPAACANITSPSKIRHKLFVNEAAKLGPGERLVPCPLCTNPSRVLNNAKPSTTATPGHTTTAECSAPRCGFLFCSNCQCEEHPGRPCRVTRSGTKLPKCGAVSSKKSKARLKRL